jgi:hypothetical protein
LMFLIAKLTKLLNMNKGEGKKMGCIFISQTV